MSNLTIFIPVSLLVTVMSVLASETCKIDGLRPFYQKIKNDGPVAEQIKKQLQIPSTSIDIAKQRPNPQVSMDYLRGDEFGLSIDDYTFSAQHTIELGGKRQKRIDKAQLGSEIEQKNIQLGLYQFYVKQINNYQRFGQLEFLIETVNKTISTFDKLVDKLEIRKALTPEESISVSTLKLASNDYKARLNDFNNEYELLKGELEFSANCAEIKGNYKKLDFEKIKNELSIGDSGLSEIERIRVKLEESNFELEKSQGYSDLSIGPQVNYQQSGNDVFVSAGVVVSFNFPLFHTNDGGKLQASKLLVHQKIKTRNNLTFLEIRKKKLFEKFQRSLKTLNQMPSIEEVEKKYRNTEELFKRGIISMSITIEAHRQNVDFLTSRFQTEQDLLAVIDEMISLTGSIEPLDKLVTN